MGFAFRGADVSLFFQTGEYESGAIAFGRVGVAVGRGRFLLPSSSPAHFSNWLGDTQNMSSMLVGMFWRTKENSLVPIGRDRQWKAYRPEDGVAEFC